MTLLRMLAFRPADAGPIGVRRPKPDVTAVRPTPKASPAAQALEAARAPAPPALLVREPEVVRVATPVTEGLSALRSEADVEGFVFDGDWITLAATLRVSGMTRQLVEQAELISFDQTGLKLRVPIRTMTEGGALDKLKKALAVHFARPVPVQIEVGAVRGTTVAAVVHGERTARLSEAQATIDQDPFVQALVRDFGGTVVPGSIKPI